MNNDKIIKFGDIVDISKESVDRENNPYERYIEGGHMDSGWLKISRWGVFGNDYVGPAFHRIFKKGQILYGSRRTYLKKVAIAEFDGITSNTTFVLTPNGGGDFNPKLIPYLMLSERFTNHSILNSKGSTNPYVNWSDIARFPIKKINNSRQKDILEVLQVAEALVFKSEELLEACEKLKSAYLESVFLPRENWKELKLQDICSIRGGRQRAPKYEQGLNPVKYLRPANIKRGKFRADDVKLMDFTCDELNEYALKKGDVLLVEGGEAEDVGDALYWEYGGEEQFAFQNTLIRLRAYKNKITPRMLYWLMVYLHGTGYFISIAAGTKIKHIGSKNTSQITICLPQDFNDINSGVAFLDELDALIVTLEVKLSKEKILFQKLINTYLE